MEPFLISPTPYIKAAGPEAVNSNMKINMTRDSG